MSQLLFPNSDPIMPETSKPEQAGEVLVRPKKPYMGKGPESTYETLRTVVMVLLAAFLIRSFIFQPFVVQGSSMEPTLHSSQYVVVNKFGYWVGKPERGDVIVFRSPVTPSQNYIKRVIGLPGEKITFDDNKVYVNGTLISENYINIDEPNKKEHEEVVLKENEFFVLGDNRDHSSDSRRWGVLPKENIIGKAFLSIFPIDTLGLLETPDY